MKKPFLLPTRIVAVGVLAGICTATALASWWRISENQHCQEMHFSGLDRLETNILVRMAEGLTSPTIVADRIRRHPWIRWAQAKCTWNARMQIHVVERQPVLRAMPPGNDWGYYLDQEGFRMPATYAVDVPIVRGEEVEPFHPLRPIESALVRKLARAVANVEKRTDALLSEFVVEGGEVRLYTPATSGFASTEVRLGREYFGERMVVLTAFWFQAMLLQPNIGLVDLRFREQVITRPAALQNNEPLTL